MFHQAKTRGISEPELPNLDDTNQDRLYIAFENIHVAMIMMTLSRFKINPTYGKGDVN